MKKAQVQTLETIGVLIFFFVLLGLGMVFYYRFQAQSLSVEEREQQSLMAIRISQQISSLPELECSKYSGSSEFACIDIIKLEIAKTLIKNNPSYYSDIFFFSNIVIQQVYPSGPDILLYREVPKEYKNYQEEDIPQIKIPVPVELYDPSTETSNYGILRIAVYT
ncbi:MAG: hypothetical protein QW331_02560 [Candidatus Woesearchaeota archaeon]